MQSKSTSFSYHFEFVVPFNICFLRRTILICGKDPDGIETAHPKYEIWPWGGLCKIVVRVSDNKDYFNYFLEEMPKIEEYLKTTPFPSQRKYTLEIYVWEHLFSSYLIKYIVDTAEKLRDTAATERNPYRQRLMMQEANKYLERTTTLLYSLSGHDDFKAGRRDLRMVLHRLLAHTTILLYTLTPNQDDRIELEKLARTSLQLFVDHEAQVDASREAMSADIAGFIRQAKIWLALKDFTAMTIAS